MTDETQIDIDKEIAERFALLPQVVKDAITSADLSKRLRDLADRHKLHIDQWQILENEVMLTLLGLREVTELAGELSSQINLPAEEAGALAGDINTIIFEPIREELERSLESPEAKEKELTEEEAARQQILAAGTSSLSASASPAPIPRTPSAPPPDQKAVRAPISSSYTSRQPSTSRKVAVGDPYREPPK